MKLRIWLRPGMFVKRWILTFLAGGVLVSLAMAMALAWVYRNYDFPRHFTPLVYNVTLQFIDHPYREMIMLGGGGALLLYGFYQLHKSLLAPFMEQRPAGQGLVDIIHEHRFGPTEPELHVVAIGGGTGLSTLLRGLKQYNIAITAIVTVGDDGGSSGRLRTEFNMPPPGDIRNCLVALADAEPVMGELFQYRFDQHGSALDGHSFGNLFITAMTQVAGSFERAVVESSRVLAVRGQVMPSSLENIIVCAEMEDGRIVRGESQIVAERGKIERIFLDPAEPAAYDPAILAILSADVIVLGPGSLYTSVLPNLLVSGITHAVQCAPATKVYVCNVATQRGETDNFRVVDHVRALYDHLGESVVDYVLVNNNLGPAVDKIKPEWSVNAVGLDGLDRLPGSAQILLRDVVNPDFPLRHDPAKLAAELLEIAREGRSSGSQPRGPRTNGRESGEAKEVGTDVHVAAGVHVEGVQRKEGM